MSKDKKGVFTDAEMDAMRTRAKELAAEAKSQKNRAEGEKDLLEAISKMSGTDKNMAEKVHQIIKENAPELFPKTWYGMPAYGNKEGKVICFFQPADKFKARYATFGFNDSATLDEDNMWPVAFALIKLTKSEEEKITSLVKKATGLKTI